jgi:NADPH:quinone reductase
VLDLVGGDRFAGNLAVLAGGGRIVVVGTVSGTQVSLDLGLLMRKRVRLIGTVMRSRPLEEKIALAREFSRSVVPLLASGRVHPVIDEVFPFERIADAHRRLESNETFGKVVLTW